MTTTAPADPPGVEGYNPPRQLRLPRTATETGKLAIFFALLWGLSWAHDPNYLRRPHDLRPGVENGAGGPLFTDTVNARRSGAPVFSDALARYIPASYSNHTMAETLSFSPLQWQRVRRIHGNGTWY